ncbi:MAG: bifunctional hydroxymethylpyrimidine kinase/phosphomethylpyrimidine kinase [Alphaproteobacteria bacterium]|nr:bifunctional hydroxymethylpyrimidine kinase/phosphomethylpyrimidine kinase [Alphaproteobacteria bacterium]MBV9859906.1 bifunctional hydroxymethylpyrimidine kinase/phosphomethylpyrimidine kinase [Alphaproteobacteria bacterium]
MRGRVLIVAGSDSGGGAGIQADIKSITMLGAYAMTAVTALTAQNTEGVFGILPIPPDFVRQQIEVVLADIGADAVKTGMLHDAAIIQTVAAALEAHAPHTPVVIDPVMVAKGGARLIEPEALEALKRRLAARAAVLTPNLPEAEILAGGTVETVAQMRDCAQVLLDLGCRAVLLKGGHLPSAVVTDVLATASGLRVWESPRIESRHTHGTGCTLASAIAAGLAQGLDVERAVDRARLYVQRAIASAPGLGRGHGPLDHAHPLRSDDG